MGKKSSLILFVLLVFIWLFVSCQTEKEMPTAVGTLIAYYAKEVFSPTYLHNDYEYEYNPELELKKGQLICDTNNPYDSVFVKDDDYYVFKEHPDASDVDNYWLLPKSKVEEKTYTMNQLAVSDIGGNAVFVAENGLTARIFWSNRNGHQYFSNSMDVDWDATEKHKECFVLSVEAIGALGCFFGEVSVGEKFLFEEQLDEKFGCVDLYNGYSGYWANGEGKDPTGSIIENWCNNYGEWDDNKTAYNEFGELLVDQCMYDGPGPEGISVAYIAELDALYVNGLLYYKKKDEQTESGSNKNLKEMIQSLWE